MDSAPPRIASPPAPFLFRQFFTTVPDELAEAAKIDGAGPMHFFWHVLLPLSRTSTSERAVTSRAMAWCSAVPTASMT